MGIPYDREYELSWNRTSSLLFFLISWTRLNVADTTSVGPLCLAESGDVGVCMFLRTCLDNNGELSGTCSRSFFLASCCVLPNSSISHSGQPSPLEEVLEQISALKAQTFPHNKSSALPVFHSSSGERNRGQVKQISGTPLNRRSSSPTQLSSAKTVKWTYTKVSYWEKAI